MGSWELGRGFEGHIYSSTPLHVYLGKHGLGSQGPRISAHLKHFLYSCGILVSRSGVEPLPLAVELQRLNHWTPREFSLHIWSLNILFTSVMHTVQDNWTWGVSLESDFWNERVLELVDLGNKKKKSLSSLLWRLAAASATDLRWLLRFAGLWSQHESSCYLPLLISKYGMMCTQHVSGDSWAPRARRWGCSGGAALGLDLEPFAFFYTIGSCSVTEVEPACLVFCRDTARIVNEYF